jgi:excisionase family DNA binding protein
MSTTELDDLLTLREAANYLKISIQTLRRAVKADRINTLRVGNAIDPNRRQIRFKRGALDLYSSQHR